MHYMQFCTCMRGTIILIHTVINGVNSDLRTVSCGVPQGSVLGALFFLLYINDLYRSIGCNNVRLYADDTAIITNNHDLNYAQEQAKELFTKLYHWCIANKLSINSDKANFVLFHMKNKPVPRNFTCITTEAMQINRVKSVQYLGMLLDENLYWHEHVDQNLCITCEILWHFQSRETFRLTTVSTTALFCLYLFSNTVWDRSIWIMCKRNHIILQIIQKKLLKLLLKWDRRTPTDFVHHRLSILKVSDVHSAKIISFVNECRARRVPDIFFINIQ